MYISCLSSSAALVIRERVMLLGKYKDDGIAAVWISRGRCATASVDRLTCLFRLDLWLLFSFPFKMGARSYVYMYNPGRATPFRQSAKNSSPCVLYRLLLFSLFYRLFCILVSVSLTLSSWFFKSVLERRIFFKYLSLYVFIYKNICLLNREIYQSICNIAECSAAQDGSLCGEY